MELKYERKDVYSSLNKSQLAKVDTYIKEYMKFLNYAKTEYLCVKEAVKMLEKNGFEDIMQKNTLKSGDKVYFVNKEKSVFASVIGKDELKSGVNIIGAHIDSPRLDLKPLPLFEKYGLALLKTQYYGGIKKYQWLNIPLAMYGVVYNEKNERIEICVGTEEDDTCFTICDLLPHLAREQEKKNANDFIDAEKMSVLVGSTKIDSKDKKEEEQVKANILKILNEKYSIKEIDFAKSDITFVPAFRAKYIGLDKGLIGGYGQDDRVCSFATLKALIDMKETAKTSVAIIVDKEEIGSVGNTSMSSLSFDLYMNMLMKKADSKADLLEVYYNSKMLSADVTAGVNPDYEEAHDIQNASKIGFGISIEKYGGSRGKGYASEASAKYTADIMKLFDENKIIYQVGTLGKIDLGGGGTIAYILANKGIDVIDCGTSVLGMHSPFEVTSKYDVYMTYLAYKAFFEN